MIDQIAMTILTFMGMKINENVKHRYEVQAHKVELMEQRCPTIQQLGPNPSDLMLQIYREQCQPLNDYLAVPKPELPKAGGK